MKNSIWEPEIQRSKPGDVFIVLDHALEKFQAIARRHHFEFVESAPAEIHSNTITHTLTRLK